MHASPMTGVQPHVPWTWLQEETQLLEWGKRGKLWAQPAERIKCSLLYVNVRSELVAMESYDLAPAPALEWSWFRAFADAHPRPTPVGSADSDTERFLLEEIAWIRLPETFVPLDMSCAVAKWTPHATHPWPHALPVWQDLNEIFLVMREEVPLVSILRNRGTDDARKTKRVRFAAPSPTQPTPAPAPANHRHRTARRRRGGRDRPRPSAAKPT
jgi:hypothetical protein